MRGPYLPPGPRRLLCAALLGCAPLRGNGPRRSADTLRRLGLGDVSGDTFRLNDVGRHRALLETSLVVDGERRRVIDDPAALFWAKVDKSGDCWLWTGARDRDGYGKFQVTIHGSNRQRCTRAHRFAFELAHGRPATLNVLHSCDRPACVRPDHLFEGTQQDNARDALKKGRWVGQRLTVDTVREVRRTHKPGASVAALARQLGCANSTAYQVIVGRSWTWV